MDLEEFVAKQPINYIYKCVVRWITLARGIGPNWIVIGQEINEIECKLSSIVSKKI